MKICPRCSSTGPFNKHKRFVDGLSFYCQKCLRAQSRDFYERNKERARADRRQYYALNKDQMNARVRANYRANSEKRLVQIQEWKDANPDKISAMSAQRRGWKAGASGTVTDEQIAARVELFGGLCAYCGSQPYEHLDHVIALARGGTNWPANLRPACAECNLSKNARTWPLAYFGSEVGGDCIPAPYVKLFANSTKARVPWRDAARQMEDREILYRDYREAIGADEAWARFRILAQRYERRAVLRMQCVCVDCGSVLQRAQRGPDYCPNFCDVLVEESA